MSTFTISAGFVNPQSIATVLLPGKFAYVMDGAAMALYGGYVSMYTINPTTGALASIYSPLRNIRLRCLLRFRRQRLGPWPDSF